MIRCAIIDSTTNTVVNVIEYASVPKGPPSGMAAHLFALAHDRAGPGWLYRDGGLVDPNPPAETVVSPIVDGAAFLARVTDAEYAAITASSNVQVRRWLDIFRLRGAIDVNGATAQAAKAGLVALGLLTQKRADEIFTA